jgi:CRISPR-associated protein (TIGR03984 family)
MTELYRRDLQEKSLTEAVAMLPHTPAEAIALVYCARRCCFARLENAALFDSDGKPVGADAFEARIFNDDFELRWLQSRFDGGERRGRAALLHETPTFGGERVPRIAGILRRQYLLWGQGDPPGVGVSAGWSSLSTARIGTLAVPLVGVSQSRRVILLAREYMAQEPEHGNTYVTEERLLGLSMYGGEAENA